MIDGDLSTWLKAQSSITTLCSTRIYAVILPQNVTYPAITFQVSDGERDYTFDGEGTMVPTDVQIDCWGETYGAARGLLAAVTAAIKNYTGLMGSTTISQVRLGDDINVYEDQPEAYRSSISIVIWNYNG